MNIKKSRFVDQHVVVTGGASGIGFQLVSEFAKRYARVTVVDRDLAAISQLQETARNYGWEVHCIEFDLAEVTKIKDLFEEIHQQYGPVDVLVNNAGVAKNASFFDLTPDVYQNSIDINVKSLVECTRHALTDMKEHGRGMVVNLASVAGHVPAPYMTAYCTTKHAVVGFTRSLRAELEFEELPIQVVLVSPGFIETKMVQKGQENGFPLWMSFLLTSPQKTATRIMQGLEKGQLELMPDVSGKMMRNGFRFFPNATVKSSKLLLTKKLSDIFSNRYSAPKIKSPKND
jgi:short-subunit dehydrogenase